MSPFITLYFVKGNAISNLKPSYFCKEIDFMATSSNQEVLMNFRISAQDHARLKSFAGSKKLTMSDLIRNTLLEKISGEADAGESILDAISKIKDGLERVSLVADAALIASCRYHFKDSEDLAGLDHRRKEALGGAKKRLLATS